MADASLYLPYVLKVPIGAEPVTLHGLVGLRRNEAVFTLRRDLASPQFPSLKLPPRLAPTQQPAPIRDPLGLKGVELKDFELAGRIRRGASGETEYDLAVQASAAFPGLPASPTLTAKLVLEGSRPRLALVDLELERPLTLTDLFGSVLGRAGTWLAPVTDQFAFTGGRMYWLEGTEAFAYPRPDPAASSLPASASRRYLPGYHVEGRFRLFGKYNFDAVLHVPNDDSLTLTASATDIDFDFVTMKQVALSLQKTAEAKSITLSASDIRILGTGNIAAAATYAEGESGKGAFTGASHVDLGTLQLPLGVGSVDVDLDIRFAWSEEDGFHITEIEGLPTGLPEIPEKLQQILNADRGGCEEIVKAWLDDVTLSLKPSLNGSPSKTGEGADERMMLPVALEYVLNVGDTELELTDAPITIDLKFEVPKTLEALPLAIFRALGENLETIVKELLARPETYAALAIEIGRRMGASAAARFICRALEKFGKELAKRLADAARALATDTIAAVAELAAMLVTVALLALPALLDFLEDILDQIAEAIKKAFTGQADSKKREARAAVNRLRRQIEGDLREVEDRIAFARESVRIEKLETRREGGEIRVDLTRGPVDSRRVPDPGESIACQLDYLTGDPGTPGAVLLSTSSTAFPQTQPLSGFAGKDYRLNASAQMAITGIRFIDDETARRLDDAANSLFGVGGDVGADDLGQYLKDRLAFFQQLNREGIKGERAFATSRDPTYMIVGRSRVGFNSRVAMAA